MICVSVDDAAIDKLNSRTIEQMPKYASWWQMCQSSIGDQVKKAIDKIDSMIATQAELNQTNNRLHDLESRFSQYQKKS